MLARCGVEAEFALDDTPPSVVVDSLKHQGLAAVHEEYNHQLREHWKLTTDSSCGYELVSPILDNHSARSVTAAARGIVGGGGYITDRCGLHVHIEVGHRDIESCEPIIALYHATFDDLIRPLLARHRIGNSYCKWSEDYEDFLTTVYEDRYSAVNVQVLNRQPTVEFRQLQGTLEAPLIYSWMHLTDSLVHEAMSSSGSPDTLRKRLKYLAPSDVTDVLSSRGVSL